MILMTLLLCSALQSMPETSQRKLFDFDRPETSGKWRSVNDTVMGGKSRGGSRIQPGRLEFLGVLSLRNRGGFASIRSQGNPHELADFDGISLRVRGDGRRYYLNVHTNHTPYGGSYRMDFVTKKGEWITIRVPFDSMRATFHGRAVPNAPPLNRGHVKSVGITLADKREGPFKVEIDWIKAYVKEIADNAKTKQTGTLPR